MCNAFFISALFCEYYEILDDSYIILFSKMIFQSSFSLHKIEP